MRWPPALQLLLCLALMKGLEVYLPLGRFVLPQRAIWVGVLLAVGVLCVAAGVIAFARQRTTVDPTRPENAARLVTGGVYRITRNPMYLGMLIILLTALLKWGAYSAALVPPLFVWSMNRGQIRREEAALETLFGDAYRAYTRRVRRWL